MYKNICEWVRVCVRNKYRAETFAQQQEGKQHSYMEKNKAQQRIYTYGGYPKGT